MVNIFIANTDNNWFDYLFGTAPHQDVNFWKPSPSNFAAIREGELLAFRLKSPRNKIGGFGVFKTASILPIGIAWDTFGQANGVSSLGKFVDVVRQYSDQDTIDENSFICCRVLVQPIFMSEWSWIALPPSWSINIVGGKTYSTLTDEGLKLWRDLTSAIKSDEIQNPGGREGNEPIERFGAPVLVHPRLGQGAFRVGIMEAYGKQCALTDGRVLPALEAAHIKPYAHGGEHSLNNGVLLRKDIHSVFDAGYATFDDELKFVVSPKVKDIFQNGNEYRKLHGQPLRLPVSETARPSLAAVRWHQQNRFVP